MIDFAALPPEINSARMYSGPGSASMLAAAAAWNTMAAEMRSAAANYGSVVSGLTSESWLGPSSMLMAAAAAPDLEWLSTTATQAEQAGTQANAAAAAYESAFAMTVPRRSSRPTALNYRTWWRPTFSVKTPRRSRPPRPNTRKCGHKMPPR